MDLRSSIDRDPLEVMQIDVRIDVQPEIHIGVRSVRPTGPTAAERDRVHAGHGAELSRQAAHTCLVEHRGDATGRPEWSN